MKKLMLIICMLVLSGCAGTRAVFNDSSICEEDVDGLTCRREATWTPRRLDGSAIKKRHTRYAFKTIEACEVFVKDKSNIDSLHVPDTFDAAGCGSDGRLGSSADTITYYVYSDGKEDGDFYYTLPLRTLDDVDEYGREYQIDGFFPIFTSKSALDKYLNIADIQGPRNQKYRYVTKLKIKRFYE